MQNSDAENTVELRSMLIVTYQGSVLLFPNRLSILTVPAAFGRRFEESSPLWPTSNTKHATLKKKNLITKRKEQRKTNENNAEYDSDPLKKKSIL